MYEFRNVESRGAPDIKTSQDLFKYDEARRQRGVEHVLGQKGPIMLRKYQSMEYSKFNLLEWMHNVKCAFDNTMDLLVGGDATFDKRARTTSRALGLLKEIWPEGVSRVLSQV